MECQFVGFFRMNFLHVAIASLTVLTGSLFAEEEKTTAPPNPAKAGFPSHWSATSWDTAEGAAFWSAPSPAEPEETAKAPVSQALPSNEFCDRQSEK